MCTSPVCVWVVVYNVKIRGSPRNVAISRAAVRALKFEII